MDGWVGGCVLSVVETNTVHFFQFGNSSWSLKNPFFN